MIAGYRYNGASGSASLSDGTIGFTGFKISGHADGNAQAVVLYIYDEVSHEFRPARTTDFK